MPARIPYRFSLHLCLLQGGAVGQAGRKVSVCWDWVFLLHFVTITYIWAFSASHTEGVILVWFHFPLYWCSTLFVEEILGDGHLIAATIFCYLEAPMLFF